MSTTTHILWGINRPDGSPVHKSPTFGSTFWTSKDGECGYPEGHQDAAEIGAKELTDGLIRLGVEPEAAKHEVVRVVIETTISRELDWPRPDPTEVPDWSVESERGRCGSWSVAGFGRCLLRVSHAGTGHRFRTEVEDES